MIPSYETLMRPVLECAANGEVHIGQAVEKLAQQFNLSEEDKNFLLPSGKQTKFANRVHWAKGYLKQAGLVQLTRRGHYSITDRGIAALKTNQIINNKYLSQFNEFNEFQTRTKDAEEPTTTPTQTLESTSTPDELLREAHKRINDSLASELLGRIRVSSPSFFEHVIVELLQAMGYGGTAEKAGQRLGKSGDDGVDGVIDQDPLGVDQIYIQAKRYAEGNNISAAAIRDFFGALNLKKAQKGIFVTTSAFTPQAIDTAKNLGMRIVLINGIELTKLMLQYNTGCRNEEALYLKKIDEDFFEWDSEESAG
mgnify:CR=1 FL=1